MNDTPSDQPPSPRAEEPLFRRLLNLIGIGRPPDSAEEIEQEIQEILDEGEEHGLITPEEGEMIASILEFKDTLAHEVMTPRTDMVMAEAATPAAELIRLITDKGFSRIPIYQENPDQIIGIIHAKDLLPFCLDRDQGDRPPLAGELAKPPWLVQENRKIIELLKIFQNSKTHMAIVTDEFGGVRGLITMEDILEEIVGDIGDEHDRTVRRWKIVDANTILTDAKVDIEYVEDFFKIELPEGPYESVGGLIIHHLDRVPEPGISILVEPLVFQVLAADKRRIIAVKINKKT